MRFSSQIVGTLPFLVILLIGGFAVSLSESDLSSADPQPFVQGPEDSDRAQYVPPPTPTRTAEPTKRCIPKDCKGESAPSSYDVNEDCLLNEEDFTAIVGYLNEHTTDTGTTFSERYDTNRNGSVEPADANVISTRIQAAECYATPTPTATSTSTATLTPTGTPTDTPTGTPTSTPTPKIVEQQCRYYALKKHEDMSSNFSEEVQRYNSISERFKTFTGEGRKLSCLDTWVEQAKARCQSAGSRSHVCSMAKDREGYWINSKGSFVDDSAFGGLMNRFFDDPGRRYRAAKSGQPEEELYVLLGQAIDSQCNIINDTVPAEELCGDLIINMMISPISLDWNAQGALRKRHATVASFPLLPTQRNLFYLWQATEEFPLLAIDNNGDGRITDGTELFGEWTFGGKQLATLNTMGVLGASRGAWRDGFEALAKLDTDNDGALTAEELSEIILFFDRNRDGISDKGELVSARSAGLTKLFVRGAVKDAITGDLVARQGFERKVDGKVLRGQSIDWYAKGFKSSTAAFQEISKDLVVTTPPEREDKRDNTAHEQYSTAAKATGDERATELDDTLSGTWRWKIAGQQETSGLFILASYRGNVRGASVTEVAVTATEQAPSATQGIVMMHRFNGTASQSNTKPSLTFSITTQGRSARSSALLEKDGTLSGTTTQTLTTGELVSYSWKAERVLQ